MIGVGAFMIFYGAKFIKWVFGIIIFLTVQAFMFGITYSYGYLDPGQLFATESVDGKSGVIAIIALVVSVVLGVIAAWYLTQSVSKVFLVVLAFQNGCILGFMILALLPNPLGQMYNFAAAGVVGVAVAYFSYKKLKYVKTLGTATFGSFLLAKGIGTFEGNFPHLLNNVQGLELDDPELHAAMGLNMSKIHMAYFGGLIFFSIVGTIVQMKYTCTVEAETAKIPDEQESAFDKEQEEGG